jgi:cytoskeletal protein RodZ
MRAKSAIAVGITLVTGLAVGVGGTGFANADPTSTSSTTSTASTTATSSSEATQYFASEVETIGEEQYPSTFTGAVLTSDGTVDVYANPATDEALVPAVDALNTTDAPVVWRDDVAPVL